MRCLSSVRCSCLWSSIFPSRPELTAVSLSRCTQRHSYPNAPDRASKRLGSLSPIARILAAVTLFLFPTVTFSASRHQGQRRIYRKQSQPIGLRNSSRKPPIASPCRRAGFVPSSKLKAEATSMQSRLAVQWA
jgi:hypothetical protein